MQSDATIAWHARPADDAIGHFETCPTGLTDDQARQRRERWGANRLPSPPGRGPLARLLAQFHNVLSYILLAAGAITAALQHWIDSAVIFGVVVINALIGFVQEGKAEKALDASATCSRRPRR